MAAELSQKDIEFLKGLDEALWNRSKDRFGSTHSFENDKRPITDAERAKVLALIKTHELPCILGSGPYGDLSMMVCNHTSLPKLTREDVVIELGETHLLGPDRPDSKWGDRFDRFAVYTHSARNKELLKFYGMPEPGSKGSYEY